jgi:hypothetical protein
MNNKETGEYLLNWCKNHSTASQFSWPTDGCGYEQHIKFVRHRNENWGHSTEIDFTEFVRRYAESLLTDK